MPALRSPRPRLARLALTFAAALAVSACGGGDDSSTAPVDAPAATVDATMGACNLPSTIIHCTVGDNTPCTATCSDSYCYNFQNFGVVCTRMCPGGVTDCPSGWSCNMMGRCRPPGVL